MLSSDQLRKIRSIELTTRRLLDDMMSGGYRSSFKGQGVQFSEHRVYVPGDDIRHIDWKVSARTRDPLVKKYEEERELSVLVVMDCSASLYFGSESRLKLDSAAEMAGMLAYAAAMSGDKVGLVLFTNEVEKVLPPKKGKAHVSRLLREIMEHRPIGKGTSITRALEASSRIMKHRGIVILVSDFIHGQAPQGSGAGPDEQYDVSIRRLARKHDVVAIQVSDRLERGFPNIGWVPLVNAETGQAQTVSTGSYSFQKWLEEYRSSHATDTETALKSGKVESLQVGTSDDPADLLVKFFGARARRRR